MPAHVVPLLVEDELMRLGTIFENVRNWQPHAVVDGRLVTGQNPASSTATAQTMLRIRAAGAAEKPREGRLAGHDAGQAAFIAREPSEPVPFAIRTKVLRSLKLMPHTRFEDRLDTVSLGCAA